MNIKKFEARTMKEALEMVKTQLGPDAVILSAKEIAKGFGADKTIEITAAYSEMVLKQKQYVQSKMVDSKKEQFNQISAKAQKEIIKKVLHDKILQSQKMQTPTTVLKSENSNVAPRKISATDRKYIDIDADYNPAPVSAKPMTKDVGSVLTEQAKNAWNNMDVQNLKTEIERLKEIIMDFKNMPQNFAQPHPGAEFGINYSLCQYFQNLIDQGLMTDVAADIILTAQRNVSPVDQKKSEYMNSWIAKYILDTTQVQTEVRAKYQLFFGPSGSGKSSFIVKLAGDLASKNRKVAIISTDTIKLGAEEQMKVYCNLLKIPFISVKSLSDWNRIAPYLNQVDHVLVDFASLNLKNEDEVGYLRQLLPTMADERQCHLVVSAKAKDKDMIEIANRYRAFNCDDLIFTSLDEINQYGIIYNMMAKLEMPLFAFSIGPKIPYDFEYATAERVLDLIMGITKQNKVSQKIEVVDL